DQHSRSGVSGQRSIKLLHYIALSTTYQRPLIAFSAMALTSLWAGELYQAFACSVLSKARITARLGGLPVSAVILSVRARYWPPPDLTAGAAFVTICLRRSGSTISLMSRIAYAPGTLPCACSPLTAAAPSGRRQPWPVRVRYIGSLLSPLIV